MGYREFFVSRSEHRFTFETTREREPAIVLMHGFPDNVHLNDRLLPYYLSPRRVIAFDFLGWGSSDSRLATRIPLPTKPVISTPSSPQLRLDQVVLVAHDVGAAGH